MKKNFMVKAIPVFLLLFVLGCGSNSAWANDQEDYQNLEIFTDVLSLSRTVMSMRSTPSNWFMARFGACWQHWIPIAAS